jgi:hypothetical protein
MVSHLAEVRRIYRGRAAGLAMPLRDANPFHWLDWLLRNTVRVLTSWTIVLLETSGYNSK